MLFLKLTPLFLLRNMSSQKDIIVEAAIEVIVPWDCSPGVLDELPLGHLVLDVGGGQVDGEEDQGEAEHVDRVH